MIANFSWALACTIGLSMLGTAAADPPPRKTVSAERTQFGGVYPHLAYFNNEGECGTGAVVPWAGRLWVITYGPHLPNGSSDKLYEIDETLSLTIRPESTGGTHANRMIHRESKQLFIGCYIVGEDRGVRVIPSKTMSGRLTGIARHLQDPANKVYFATMEEGFYEVDVKTLAVKELYPDANSLKNHAGDLLPGYHGKGLYTGQGRLIYSNNGELSPEAQRRPDIASGCLAEWDGKAWTVVRRNQFTEVSGPGGIFGNDNPDKDPVWSIGWDHRSLILMLLDGGEWHTFRLPKASHSYDGAHGWNTEWPRIRDIGEKDLLMTMHGTFWRFPKSFSLANSAGISPRSNYLKVVGDFCRWGDHVVFGCDDTAKNEFLNKRKAKGAIAGPGQSQSNLWFVEPAQIDKLGPALGRGAVWQEEAVKANTPSDPFLFAGYERRSVHLSHNHSEPVEFRLEIDADGTGKWTLLKNILLARPYQHLEFTANDKGAWIRLKTNKDCEKVTAIFNYSNGDSRPKEADAIFAGIAAAGEKNYTGGLIRARGENKRNLQFASSTIVDGKVKEEGLHELGADAKLRKVDDAAALEWTKKNVAVPEKVLRIDEASVVYIDDAGKTWRLPKGDPAFDQAGIIPLRIDREVCTERDLFNAHGTFYELPADNAGGFAKIRPVCTHNRRITDYCSYRGLLVMSGIAADAPETSSRIVRSDDGKAALWLGSVDELWRFGKPRGIGGPWKDTAVRVAVPSEPYLMSGYDRKTLTLSHDSKEAMHFAVQVDIAGTGLWKDYDVLSVPSGRAKEYRFPDGFQAYWVRLLPMTNCRATARFVYD